MKKCDIRLEKQAFDAVFKSIVADLSLCPVNCSSASKDSRVINSYSSIVASTRLSDPKFLRDLTRHRLDQTLVGVVSENVRARLVEKFKNSFLTLQVSLRPSSFLSCVLDQSFEKLEAIVTDPGFAPDLDVIPAIANYSPFVKSLKLDFSICSDSATDAFRAGLKSLHLLTELKELAIVSIPKAFDKDLTLVGESCQKLETLKFGPFLVTAEFLRGIVTQHHYTLEDVFCAPLPDVRVPNVKLNSYCHTLKYLDLEGARKQDYNRVWNFDMVYGIAVILRSVPNLEILRLSNLAVPDAIRMLWKGAEANRGQLKLKSLDTVKLHDQPTLEAISELCPCLESIAFVDERDYPTERNNSVDPEILQVLARMTNVQRISFKEVDSTSVSSVTRHWSSQLTTLEITGSVEIPVDVLAACCSLTDFSCGSGTKFDLPPGFDTHKQTLLPKLVNISLSSCLYTEKNNGPSTEQLLLLKSSLRHVKLECCHLADSSQDWEKLFRQWHGLESLQIKSAHGLDENLIGKLLGWMPKLKDVILPASLRSAKEVRGQLSALKDKWSSRGVKLDFDSLYLGTLCLNRPSPSRWEPSDTEEGAENWDAGDDDDDDNNHFFGGHYINDPYDDLDFHDPFGMDDDYDDYSDFDYEGASGDDEWNSWE